MASNFTVLSTKYYDQIVNGSTFASNLSSFNTIPTGNEGDTIQLVQRVQIAVDYGVNSSKSVSFNELAWDSSICSFTWVNNAYTEGFYIGANVKITRGINSRNFTITNISGFDNREIFLSGADGTTINAWLPYDALYTDLEFRLISKPTFINYKYGLNKTSDLFPTYGSYFDSNVLSYYLGLIPNTPTYSSMTFVGGQQGANLGGVEATYIGLSDTYRYTFEIKHTFKIHFYKSGELSNLELETPTSDLIGTSTYRYDNRYEMGTAVYHNSIFETSSVTGNIGYFNENFNGLSNDYSISGFTITNGLGTGVLEATEINTISFQVVSSTDDWQSGVACIASHAKLPTPLEYQNQTTPFDTIWIWESVRNIEGGGAFSGTLIEDLEITINGSNPKILDVEFLVTFSVDQQALIDESDYLLYFTVANKNLTNPTIIDKVNLILDVNQYSKSTDVSGLITVHQLDFFPSWNAFDGQTAYSNFTGGDGDLWGVRSTFKLDTVRNAKLRTAGFKVYSTDGDTEIKLVNKPFILGLPLTTTDGTYIYQLLNVDYLSDLNLPSDEQINRIYGLIELPTSLPSTTQDVELRCGFQITWRDWLENLTVPLSFYDASELQNNRNYKTSNYVGTYSFNVYGAIEVGISSDVNDSITLYRIESDISTVLDFDVAAWTGFDGVSKFYNLDGDEIFAIPDGEDIIIKTEFTHGLGVLSLANLAGEIWVENNLSTIKPDYLATYRDWTSDTNFLQPSDTLLTGNYQFVEVVSVSNKVTLICKTNHLNVVAGGVKNVYGRLWNKA